MAPKKKDPDYSYTELEDPSIIEERLIEPSTLEDIDQALYNYVNDELNVFCTTNKGWNKVPIIWVSSERSFHIKNNKDIRDDSGAFILPAISIERQSITKDPARRAAIYGNALENNGGAITVARRINQDKTAKFANASSYYWLGKKNFPRKNNKIVFETITVPIPIYVDIDYAINIRVEYQQQMNEIMAPFLNTGRAINYFPLSHNGHNYEGFIDPGYSLDSNLASIGEEERMYQTTVSIKVLGYLIGSENNQKTPILVKEESAAVVQFPRETAVLGDIPEHIGKKGFYREIYEEE